MPISPTYPGVYIQELPSGVHTIAGASTSNTAFVDFFSRGPVGVAQRITSFTDFERFFGGLDKRSEASYQIMQYYLNGGQIGYVVRVVPESSVTADVDLREPDIVIPGSITLGAKDQAQFTATVDGGVTWSVNTPSSTDPTVIGSIDPVTGLYQAPSPLKLPAGSTSITVTVVAQGKKDCSSHPTATITLNPVSVSISPADGIAGPGEQILFKAAVAGSSNQKVKWFLAGGAGSIDANGLYTAPASIAAAATVTVHAKAVADAKAADATQTLKLQPVHVTAARASIASNQSVLLTAHTASSVLPSSIAWTFTGAPATPITGQTYCYKPAKDFVGDMEITATAGDQSDKSTITVVPQYSVTINVNPPVQPASDGYHVEVGNALELSAVTAGDPSNAVTWSASAGVIDDQGVYRAPASLPNPTAKLDVVITAASSNDPSASPQSNTLTIHVDPPESRFRVTASSPGVWGNHLRALAMKGRLYTDANPVFTLLVQETDALGNVLNAETFSGLSASADSVNYCVSVVNDESSLVRLVDFGGDYLMPYLLPYNSPDADGAFQILSGGDDGAWDETNDEFATALRNALTDDSSPLSYLAPDLFNILCLPATADMDADAMGSVMSQAQTYCASKRAFYIVDIPNSQVIPSPQKMAAWFENNLEFLDSDAAAIYYPRLNMPDPLDDYRVRETGSSGTLAGLYASTDLARGVWKAPAGTQIPLSGASPVYVMKDTDNGLLNPLGINAIRSFPVYGVLSWGARTLRGADELADQWKYIPVRRIAQYIENSLYAGLTWAVFEPNDTPLWSSIVLNVTAFMNSLFRQGAFQGSSPKDAYFVKCDASTTTQYDIDRGVVNVVVGFAPLKPAEFVIVQIQQIAGQSAS